jgi:anti-sigma factor RsiW
MTCADLRPWLVAYADDELGVEKSIELEAHLERCSACRTACDRHRALRHVVGRLYPHDRLPDDVRRTVLRRLRRPRRSVGAAAIAAALVAVVATVVALRGARRAGPDAVPAEVAAALGLHTAVERGDRAPAFASSDLADVNRWLSRALPFAGPIPEGAAGDLRLAGASTARLGAETAGWVLYRRGPQPVSLFILPPRAWPAIGREIRQRGIEFRSIEVGTHRIVAWNHAPVSYLLVSARDRPAAEACAVCHAGPQAPAIAGFGRTHGS